MRVLLSIFAAALLFSSCTVEVIEDIPTNCDWVYDQENRLRNRLDRLNYEFDMGLIAPVDYDYEFGFAEGQLYQLELDFPECFY